jgi:hypothetical protein
MTMHSEHHHAKFFFALGDQDVSAASSPGSSVSIVAQNIYRLEYVLLDFTDAVVVGPSSSSLVVTASSSLSMGGTWRDCHCA